MTLISLINSTISSGLDIRFYFLILNSTELPLAHTPGVPRPRGSCTFCNLHLGLWYMSANSQVSLAFRSPSFPNFPCLRSPCFNLLRCSPSRQSPNAPHSAIKGRSRVLKRSNPCRNAEGTVPMSSDAPCPLSLAPCP